LGLLALRLLAGDQNTTDLAQLPATTPDLLRQVITDTLANPPQRRPLPEAWNYLLGNAIEQAQHRLSTATPTSTSTAPAPPPTPQVHSRPSTPSTPSTPPARPAAPVSQPAPINEGVPEISESLTESAPPPQRLKRPTTKTLLIGANVVLVVALALAIGIPALNKHRPTASPVSQPPTLSTTTAPTTTTPSTPPPVAESALDGLLLSPDRINAAMGTTDMTINGPASATDWYDMSDVVAYKTCLPLVSPAEDSAYAGSGSTGVRSNYLTARDIDIKVSQAVASFSSARDAGKFFTSSAGHWPDCHQFHLAKAGKPDIVYTVGPVSNSNGLLSVNDTMGGGDSSLTWEFMACQRALTVANNVVIDVLACSRKQSINSAVDIANQIAANVPAT
jgi:hypothetical protein